ncbi:hypothetical protein HUO13_26870 [Saccharopolyspora erythraea]|uniref:hypothetical protein n=1 Tax=Saccharopolyspora erythraea TaxID=1836 RepID=UPI001BA83594|nr:hypothetical protein [Saccharopolyspora erythraea]QUH03957.1 hypothetical protein HUO13_26870 [Saccharopolyspora erythraea]
MATKQRKSEGRGVTTVNLPGVTAELHQPDHYIPTRDDLANAANTVRSYLPSGKAMVFYGGLGALAAFDVLAWPVAAAIGVGTALAQQSAAESRSGSSGGQRSAARSS